jgi:hypothetical protein
MKRIICIIFLTVLLFLPMISKENITYDYVADGTTVNDNEEEPDPLD